jgi:ATPase subunit of ABC transporter with duplicated ATPase domains
MRGHYFECSWLLTHKSVRNFSSIASFKKVCFGHGQDYILQDVDFSIEEGSKVTIMGQNGSGKSTIINLLSGNLSPESGRINVRAGERVACARQTMPSAWRDLTVKSFFAAQFAQAPVSVYELEKKMAYVLEDVLLEAPRDRIVKSFSGGQQARLLLAAALIQDPTLLLLDEPTNNLDHAGLDHLQSYIQQTNKTCIVISHDEDFLNSFTDQVLYLDIHSKRVETYAGDYFFVKAEIEKRINRENAQNAQLLKHAQAKKEQANKFKDKGGGMRKVAKTMREAAEEMESQVVDVRREDVALKNFVMPYRAPPNPGRHMEISQVSAYERTTKMRGDPVELRKGSRVQVCGPNGIGKTTFLELIASGRAPGVKMSEKTIIGYYRQDFTNFDFNSTVMQCLELASAGSHTVGEMRSCAASFLLREQTISQKVRTLSEGQKGLLSLACLCLLRPSILILDEPTNHINFRHLPALANAVRNFEGPVLIVSHDSNFVKTIGVNSVIDMGKEFAAAQKSNS